MKEIKDVEIFERAEGLAFELASRAYIFRNPNSDEVIEGWVKVAKQCGSAEEAKECDFRENRIREILAKSCKSELSREEIDIIQAAAKEWETLPYLLA